MELNDFMFVHPKTKRMTAIHQKLIHDVVSSDIEVTSTGSAAITGFCITVGPGTTSDGPGERWAAHHIIRATHNGAGHVRGSGSDHNAGPCIWSPGTTTGKG